jgi:threonine synthase
MSSYSFNDKQTLDAVKRVYENKNYVLDPHGAVGYLGLKKFLSSNQDRIGIFLETAHPIKFSEHIEKVIERKLDVPESINKILLSEKKYIDVNDYNDFKEKMLFLKY